MADKTEFLQAIDDAILDADSLERFINGSDSETVLTRLSAEYPTLQKALKELFEAGGLPATPFKTKALMEASALVDGDYAMVTDDADNNGLYVKAAGAWVKSDYDPVGVSKNYLDEQAMGIKTIPMVAGNITADGTIATSSQYSISKDYLRTYTGDELVIKGYGDAEPSGHTYKIVEYDENKVFVVRGITLLQHKEDSHIALKDGYTKVIVRTEDYATAEDLLAREDLFYIKYSKLRSLGDNTNESSNETGSVVLTSEIPLEIGGLEKIKSDKYTDIGRITNSKGITADSIFLDKRRSRRFLQVISGSDLTISYDDGECSVFEYDSEFACLGVSNVDSEGTLSLDTTTKYIKIMLEMVTKHTPVVTVTFKSATKNPAYIYNENIKNVGNYISFMYEAYPNHGLQIFDAVTDEQYKNERYFSTGLLKLPPNYDPEGEPVRLLIFVQGSSGYLNIASMTSGSTYESADYTTDQGIFNYWLNEGYAVLSLYPWTSKYNIEIATNSGTPTGMAAYQQGYQWVVDNYNIKQDGVFVSGKSSGGYCGAMLAFTPSIPVLAVGLLAPVISPVFAQLAPNTEVRQATADDFGFEGDHTILEMVGTSPSSDWLPAFNDYMRQNGEKMIGYNPWWAGVINEDITALIEGGLDGSDGVYELMKHRKRVCPVPVKIWCAADDRVTTYEPSRAFVQSIRNANGNAELRTMPDGTGGHYAVDTSPDALKVESITTKLGIEHKNTPLAMVELVHFFRRYG